VTANHDRESGRNRPRVMNGSDPSLFSDSASLDAAPRCLPSPARPEMSRLSPGVATSGPPVRGSRCAALHGWRSCRRSPPPLRAPSPVAHFGHVLRARRRTACVDQLVADLLLEVGGARPSAGTRSITSAARWKRSRSFRRSCRTASWWFLPPCSPDVQIVVVRPAVGRRWISHG